MLTFLIIKKIFNIMSRQGWRLSFKKYAVLFRLTPQAWPTLARPKAEANVPSAPPARRAFTPHQIRAAAGGISASAEHRRPHSGRGAQRPMLC